MADESVSSMSSAAETSCNPLTRSPLSSMSGLTNADAGKDKPGASNLKDSDSPYARLSKRGGQKNLLTMEQGGILRKQQPAPYKQNQWYYHLDNAKEDAVEHSSVRYQPAFFVDDKQFLPKIEPQARAKGLSPRGAGSSKNVLKGQIPPGGFPKVGAQKPLVCSGQGKGKATLTNPSLYSTAAAKRKSSSVSKLFSKTSQPDWKEGMKAHYKTLQANPPQTFKPASEYQHSFGPALFGTKRKDSQKASVKSMFSLPVKKDPLPHHAGCTGFAAGKKSEEHGVNNKFKNVGPRVGPRVSPRKKPPM